MSLEKNIIIVTTENQLDFLLRNALQGMINQLQTQESKQTGKKALSVNELAKDYNLSKSLIYKLTSSNEIPHYKRGAKVFFNREEIEKWLLSDRQATITEKYAQYQENKKGVKNG